MWALLAVVLLLFLAISNELSSCNPTPNTTTIPGPAAVGSTQSKPDMGQAQQPSPDRSSAAASQPSTLDHPTNAIDRKLSQGITPSAADIDAYTSNPEMREALKAFYGIDGSR